MPVMYIDIPFLDYTSDISIGKYSLSTSLRK